MRRLAFLSLPLLAFVLAGGGTPGLDADTPSPSPSPSPSAEPSPSPLPSPTPVLEEKGPPAQKDDFAPPTSPNPDYQGSLKPGDWVQVTGTGDCLNVRLFPGSPPPPPPDAALPPDFQTPDNVINCLPDGFVGRLAQWDQQQMPVSADGHWWWNITGVGWVINVGNDTIVVGVAAGNIACGSNGSLGGVLVNNSVAAAIVISDAGRTIMTVPASQAAGTYYNLHNVDFSGYLKVATTSTNDVTVFHSPTLPLSYAM